jgi:hypothetical protein
MWNWERHSQTYELHTHSCVIVTVLPFFSTLIRKVGFKRMKVGVKRRKVGLTRKKVGVKRRKGRLEKT